MKMIIGHHCEKTPLIVLVHSHLGEILGEKHVEMHLRANLGLQKIYFRGQHFLCLVKKN